MKAIFKILTIFVTLNCTAQVEFESTDYISENVTIRGFKEPSFLFSEGNVAYYAIKQYDYEYSFLIVAIHKKTDDEQILNLKLAKPRYAGAKPVYNFKESKNEISLIEEKIIPYFPKARKIEFFHFISNLFLDEKNDYGYFNLLERPIIKSLFKKQSNNTWYDGNFYYGKTVTNSVNDALANRKIKLDNTKVLNKLEENTKIDDNYNKPKKVKDYNFSYLDTSLKTEGIIKHIYLGNFDSIPFTRENNSFRKFFDAYIFAYSTKCESNLPDNKIQLYRKRCVEWNVTKENGIETGRSCLEWAKEPTGIYAKPELYKARETLNEFLRKNVFKIYAETLLKISQAKDFEAIMNLGEDDFKTELFKFIEINGCSNEGLIMFEENLVRFVENRPSIKRRK